MAVHRLGDQVVNWYLVEDGGKVTAVDAGLPKHADTLEADLAALGHKLEDVQAVVLTHSDGDHIGCVPALQAAGARVFIHGDDLETLRKPGPKGGDAAPAKMVRMMVRPRFWKFMIHMARGGGAKPKGVEGAETFSDGDVLDVPGKPRAIHTPGHTPGHSSFFFEGEKALFAGDSLCTWNPLTDERSPQVMPKHVNTDYTQCFESLAAMETVGADTLLVGHGLPWEKGAKAAVEAARAHSKPD